MPTHSGIKLEVLSSLELAVHTEFPHPESSQFTFRSPNRAHTADWEPPAASKSSKADVLLGRNTTCAVYIPSVAGARFWLRYDIEDLAVQRSKYYYFKLFMNGRHIASFGVDATKKPRGQVMHGLFDPSPEWNYEHDGEIWKNNGLEKRSFYFVGGDKNRSAVNDGGLIEVLCFRATGRRRKIPDPESWRDQPDYGIVTPSDGLHEHPEQAKFYDWHLKDPKTNPLVVFKFHYRSWESLKMLELIPANHSCKMEQSERTLSLLPAELKAILDVKNKDFHFLHKPHPECEECRPMISPYTDESSSLDETDNDDEEGEGEDDDEDEDLYDYHEMTSGVGNGQNFWAEGEISPLKIRRGRPTAATSKATGSKYGNISPTGSPLPRNITHGALDAFSERPLPDLPTRSGSKSSKRHSRSSSTVSRAPSVTPSLLTYIDRDGAMSPEPQFGVAHRIEVAYNGPVRIPSLKSDSDTMDNIDSIMTPPPPIITTGELTRVSESTPLLRRKPTFADLLPSGVSKMIRKKPSAVSSALTRREISAPLSLSSGPLTRHNISAPLSMSKASVVSGSLTRREISAPLSLSSGPLTRHNISAPLSMSKASVVSGSLTRRDISAPLSMSKGAFTKQNISAPLSVSKPSVVSGSLNRRDISTPLSLSTDLVPSSSLSNFTVRTHRRTDSKKQPALPKSKTMGNMLHRQEPSDELTVEEVNALHLAEGDWMRRSSSRYSSAAMDDDHLGELPGPITFNRNMVSERVSSLGSAFKRTSSSWFKRKPRTTPRNENTPDNSSSDLSHIEEGQGPWV